MFRIFRRRPEKPSNTKKQVPGRMSIGQRRLRLESLEDRSMLSAVTVTNLNDSGTGSLRAAITAANAASGPTTIDFSVSGTIELTGGMLPAITQDVDIAGNSAPGYAGTPKVEINFNGYSGLQFNAGSAGSTVDGLSLVGSESAALMATNVNDLVFTGDYIGLLMDGTTVDANAAGIGLVASSDDTIGGTSASLRNVVSGNGGNGITLGSASNDTIEDNYIGTDATGTVARANQQNGIALENTSTLNTISGNVVSGNDGDGVLLNGESAGNTLTGNVIGLAADGVTSLGNRLDGIELQTATGNTIGNDNAVSSVTYNQNLTVPLNTGGTVTVNGWQGLTGGSTSGQYIMTGTAGSGGIVFEGTLAGAGTGYLVNVPFAGVTETTVYSAYNEGSGELELVGTYQTSSGTPAVNGFLFQGTTAQLGTAANYTTIDYPGATYNYMHSVANGLAVGNFDNPAQHGQGNLPLGPGNAFVYDIATQSYTSIVYPGSISNTAYGIWYNGGTSYTIVGGYSDGFVNNFTNQNQPLDEAYIVDYNSATGQFSNWASVANPADSSYLSHFEGISSTQSGVYTMVAESGPQGSPLQASLVTIVRNADGSFGTSTWTPLTYSGTGEASGQSTTGDSVYGTAVNGIVAGNGTIFAYSGQVNYAFQLSNVISGNGTNGIELNDSPGNTIAMNNIGTDTSGNLARGNGANGILVTDGSENNMIGGEATGGNDPTNSVFVRPPQGNLISGNALAGVLINGGSTGNQLSGNYIGTNASGNVALGNAQDGVKIVDSNDNSLIGCNFTQDPFVFYNVIGGNGGNGLYVLDSNGTTIQANFFGVGANNSSAVGNTLNGVLIAGDSTDTVMGGPIPLGNVDAANGQNGIVVQGTASDFTSYNTFCGLAAFSLQPNLGNGRDGMLITSTGYGILIRTNVITENAYDGIEIGGGATGVTVVSNIIGLNTSGLVAMGNKHDGVEVDAGANGDVIGGPAITGDVVPQNTISGNAVDGVAIDGGAHNITINNSFIGTDVTGEAARPNGASGVYVAPGSNGNIIGSSVTGLNTVISGNSGNGVEMNGNSGNIVIGSYIGENADDTGALPNGGNGIYLGSGTSDIIGSRSGTVPQNIIANNSAYGVDIYGGSKDGVHQNSIFNNHLAGIELLNGANNGQVAPTLASVVVTGSNTIIGGTLTAADNTVYTLEFFASTLNGGSGQYLLGTTQVTTNSVGLGTFLFTGSLAPGGATYYTATATDPIQNTS
ncbi:MAG TPA: right-handed parallel beta-helix repeat-containing protein, partial [Pirellulales bacterium]|nr:right-handed parallel beta-helix repeat-containing protein [Pirellulales bacterium]